LGVVILLVLAGVWAAVLIPPIVRARSEGRPSGTVGDFNRQLQVLARTTPAGRQSWTPTYSPTETPGPLYRIAPRVPTRRRAQKRRRDVLLGLLVVSVGSLLLGVLPPLRVLWMVHIAADVVLAAYIALLIYARNVAAERDAKVRFLPSGQQQPEPALLLRRSAN
jgi:hypothetical protein